VASTRRQFLRSAAASSAVIAFYGSPAFAAGVSDEALVAGRVLDALVLTSFNNLPQRDWAVFVEQRFRAGAGDQREAFAALRASYPDFAQLSPEAATQRLAHVLLPGYDGPRSIDRARWMLELDANRAAIANGPRMPVPADTGQFDGSRSPQAVLDKLLVVTPAAELRASRVASRVLEAANVLATRSEPESKNGLAVAL
jgi:hypothetical protein